jgi:hypothetical protein
MLRLPRPFCKRNGDRWRLCPERYDDGGTLAIREGSEPVAAVRLSLRIEGAS